MTTGTNPQGGPSSVTTHSPASRAATLKLRRPGQPGQVTLDREVHAQPGHAGAAQGREHPDQATDRSVERHRGQVDVVRQVVGLDRGDGVVDGGRPREHGAAPCSEGGGAGQVAHPPLYERDPGLCGARGVEAAVTKVATL